MKIINAKFLKSISGEDELLFDRKSQIAFIGRSNVGKSSLINSLSGQKSLAKSSSTPGKTLRINIYDINEELYFLDFPGYGYAKIDKSKREQIRKMIIWYLSEVKVKNRLFILVIDASVGITAYEKDILEIIGDTKSSLIIVANKTDKLNQSQKAHTKNSLKESFPNIEYILYSTKKKGSEGELLEIIEKHL